MIVFLQITNMFIILIEYRNTNSVTDYVLLQEDFLVKIPSLQREMNSMVTINNYSPFIRNIWTHNTKYKSKHLQKHNQHFEIIKRPRFTKLILKLSSQLKVILNMGIAGTKLTLPKVNCLNSCKILWL